MPMKTKGSWRITNLKGIERVFKDAEHPDAIAWMSNRQSEEEYKASEKTRKAALPKPAKKKVVGA